MITFEQYLADPPTEKGAWIRAPGDLHIFVKRTGYPCLGGWKTPPRWRDLRGDFQFSNMLATPPGQGALTRFLDTWEEKYSLCFWDVPSIRLQLFLASRGYRRLGLLPPLPCFVRHPGD